MSHVLGVRVYSFAPKRLIESSSYPYHNHCRHNNCYCWNGYLVKYCASRLPIIPPPPVSDFRSHHHRRDRQHIAIERVGATRQWTKWKSVWLVDYFVLGTCLALFIEQILFSHSLHCFTNAIQRFLSAGSVGNLKLEALGTFATSCVAQQAMTTHRFGITPRHYISHNSNNNNRQKL